MFMCQVDSYLQQFETVVTSVVEIEPSSCSDDNLKCAYGVSYSDQDEILMEIILEDTILFPEGGGQPDDRGTINDIPVLRVIRRGKDALHILKFPRSDQNEYPIKPNNKVQLEVDWKRRFDHMQQHSAQHLITALADALFEFPTTSWWLGTQESYIELDTPDITEDQIKTLEEKVNEKIRKNNKISVEVVDLDDPAWKSVRTRGLPEDVQNEIRIICIDGIDANVCCGTHVNSLSQLQIVKLLHLEKKKGKSHLHFISGERVMSKLAEMNEREKKLLKVLKSSPSELVSAAERISNNLKMAKKSAQILGKDLASLEANRFKTLDANGLSRNGIFYFYHREHVDLEFGTTLLRELGETRGTIILVILKSEDNVGHVLLRGGEDVITNELLAKLGDEICRVLDGKGTLRGNLFQAKVGKINSYNKAAKLAKKFVDEFVLPK